MYKRKGIIYVLILALFFTIGVTTNANAKSTKNSGNGSHTSKATKVKTKNQKKKNKAIAAGHVQKLKGSVSGTTVLLKWTKSGKANKYEIYQYKSKKWKKIKTVKKLNYTVTKLKKKTTYKFKVRGIDGKKKRAFSNVLTIKTGKTKIVKPTTPLTGNFTMTKTIMFEDSGVNLVDDNPFSKMKFVLYADENIMAGKKIKYKAGSRVGVYTPDKINEEGENDSSKENGYIHLKNIYPGKYHIEETEHPDYLISTKVSYPITVKKIDDEVVISNIIPSSKMIRQKEVANLRNKEIIKSNNMIIVKSTDSLNESKILEIAKAKAYSADFSKDEESGYYNREKYTLGDEVKLHIDESDKEMLFQDIKEVADSSTFEILLKTEAETEIKLVIFVYNPNVDMFENADLTITNQTTKVELNNTDIVGDNLVEGAHFVLSDKNGKSVAEWNSNDEGFVVEGLKHDEEYTLKETKAPENYVLSDKELKFNVSNIDDIQKYETSNMQAAIRLVDENNEPLDNSKVEIIDKETGKKADSIVFNKLNDSEDQKKETEDEKDAADLPDDSDAEENDASDQIYLNGLVEGKTYIVKQTETPKGYQTSDEFEFTLTKQKAEEKTEIKIDGEDSTKEDSDNSKDGNEKEEISDCDVLVTVKNKKIKLDSAATDQKTNDHVSKSSEKIVINDEVDFKNLTKGKEYYVKASFIDKETNEVMKDDKGKEIIGQSEKFTADKETGKIEIPLEFSGAKLGGKVGVIQESLYEDGVEIVKQENNEEKGYISIPKIENSSDYDEESRTIKTDVSYSGLVKDQKYKITGWLVDKKTGEKIEGTEKNVEFEAKAAECDQDDPDENIEPSNNDDEDMNSGIFIEEVKASTGSSEDDEEIDIDEEADDEDGETNEMNIDENDDENTNETEIDDIVTDGEAKLEFEVPDDYSGEVSVSDEISLEDNVVAENDDEDSIEIEADQDDEDEDENTSEEKSAKGKKSINKANTSSNANTDNTSNKGTSGSGSSDSGSDNPENQNNSSYQTGDIIKIGVLGLIAGLCFIAAGTMIYKRRKY